jgi:hypothetical protein
MLFCFTNSVLEFAFDLLASAFRLVAPAACPLTRLALYAAGHVFRLTPDFIPIHNYALSFWLFLSFTANVFEAWSQTGSARRCI